MSDLAGFPIKRPRPVGGGALAEVFAGEGDGGPVVLKVARSAPRGGEDVTNGVFFAEGRALHTGGVGGWQPTPAEAIAAEARVLRRISQPAFPRLLDEGETRGRRWLLLRFIPGRDLRQAIHADGDVTRVHVGELAAALLAAHRAGELPFHGDVKPDNLRLDDRGRLRVLDPSSGLARLGPDGAPVRLFTSALYNPMLEASDVPSIGLVLIEVLTRKVAMLEAHEGRPLAPVSPALEAHLAGARALGRSGGLEALRRLPPLTELAKDVDPADEALALSCLGLARRGGVLDRVAPPTLEALAAALRPR